MTQKASFFSDKRNHIANFLYSGGNKPENHLKYLDGWRGYAILCVLLGHFLIDSPKFPISKIGVDLFFILSGRLMAEILFERKCELGMFFLRRISRIYPVLFIYATTVFVLFYSTKYGPSGGYFLSAVTLTINYYMVYFGQAAVYGHLWSLAVEEHCYIFLAALAFLSRRNEFIAFSILFAIGLLAVFNCHLQISAGGSEYVYWQTDVQIAPFAFSAALYLIFSIYKFKVSPLLPPIAFFSGIFLKLSTESVFLKFGLSTICLGISINSIDASLTLAKKLFELKAVRCIGVRSFSIYIWQQPFYLVAKQFPHLTIVLFFSSIIVSLISFVFIENPARKYFNSRWETRKKFIIQI